MGSLAKSQTEVGAERGKRILEGPVFFYAQPA